MAQAVSIDCEFVRTRAGEAVASVCVVDEDLQTLLLSYVKPESPIIDYKTKYSGIRPEHMVDAPTLAGGIRSRISRLVRGRLIVGHDVHCDLKLLGIRYKEKLIRNTAILPRFLDSRGRKRKLKYLALEFLGESIQDGSHSAAEDARAAMKLYIVFWDLPGPAPPRRPTCWTCGIVGHRQSACPEGRHAGLLQVQAPAKRPLQVQAPVKSPTCQFCGIAGHTQSSCPRSYRWDSDFGDSDYAYAEDCEADCYYHRSN
eukprot:GHVS01083569.1.p1 GENE.GHVS01083569.1~~GHVS01083569.1.p1  ORF type:complete len:257 (+),score=16.06 GHVS01083569.1:151-921(+)